MKKIKIIALVALVIVSFVVFQSCRHYPAIRTAQALDLQAFMGDWYVLGACPRIVSLLRIS